MTLEEARELLDSPIWPKVRDGFLATGEFNVYPSGDVRRISYLDDETRHQIDLWKEALEKAPEWRTLVDGARVRELRERYPGVYPEVFRYTAYFAGGKVDVMKLLKLKFPEAYRLCCC